MNIVVYPGSFNPIHTGHAMLASYLAQYVAGVDEVWLSVTPENPLKPLAGGATDSNRLEMARMVAESLPRVKVTDIEFELPRPSYTYATLCALADKYPMHRFSLLVGSDNWLIFEKWREYNRILTEFGVKIYKRPGYEVAEGNLPAGAEMLKGTPQIELSSTFIREGLGRGMVMNFFLPTVVDSYIKSLHLYGCATNQ